MREAEAAAVRHLPPELPDHGSGPGRPPAAPAPAGPGPDAHAVSVGVTGPVARVGGARLPIPRLPLLSPQREADGLEGLPVSEEQEERHHGVISYCLSPEPPRKAPRARLPLHLPPQKDCGFGVGGYVSHPLSFFLWAAVTGNDGLGASVWGRPGGEFGSPWCPRVTL